MDAYWELSDFDVNKREKGFEILLQSLKTPAPDQSEEKNEKSQSQTDYAVSRLIKGLVSNRQCARIGFASALGSLVGLNDEQLAVPSADDVLTLIQTKLTTKKETGVEDAKNVRIGRVLGYIAMAFTHKDQDLSSLLSKVLPDLLTIRKQETRRRLRAFVDACIVQLAKWAGRKIFKKEIFPHIQDLFPNSWEMGDDGSKSIFLLVSLANLYPKHFDGDFFQMHWHQNMLPLGTTAEEQTTIKKCLQSFDNELHVLEQLCQQLLFYAIRTEQVSSFWSVLVDELSNIGFDSNKAHILMNLIVFSLQEQGNLNVLYTIETILDQSSTLFGKILELLSSSGRKTHQESSVELAKQVIDKLAQTLTGQPFEVRLRLFEKLLNCADKNYTCLHPVGKAVIEKLTVDELSAYMQRMIGLFCEESKEDESALERRRHFLLEMISDVCECPAFDLKIETCATLFETMLSIVSLLAYFKLNNNHIPKQLREFLRGNVELSEMTREHLEDTIYKLLMYEFQHNHYEHSYAVFRKAMHWCESTKHYTPLFRNAEETKTYLQEKSDELATMIQGESIQGLTDEKLRLAFQQVFVLAFYDLFSDFNRAKQYLEDLTTCVKNAHEQFISKKIPETEESSWIEVFIDILLSMYTKKQHHIRSMIKKIYHHIVPHLTENALKLMLQTVAPEDETDDEDEDDDMDEDGEGDDQNEDDNESDDDDDDDEEEEEDEELMETGDVNEELRQAVEKALGNAALKEDQDDDADMDDETMLRLDPMIAEAFRSRLKKSSNIKLINEKLHHQFRVLDLIESTMKKDERMRFVLISIRPLIETLISLPSTPAYKSMTERLDSILRHLSNRKIDHSEMPSTDECLELFRYLTSLAGTRTKLSTETLTKVSMFVIKLCLHVGKLEDRLAGVEEMILTRYESGFLRFLSPNESKKPAKKNEKQQNGNKDEENQDEEDDESMPRQPVVHPMVMKEFLSRFPEYSRRSMLLMVQTALKDTINWKKRNIVCGTLNKFLNKKQSENVDPSLLEAIIHLLVKMCHDPKASKMESLHVITVLTQKLLLIRNPPLTQDQASTLFDAVSTAIKAKPINSDKQRKQLLNLMQSFRKRFQITIPDELMSSLTKKRKSN